ncbi:MAG TPA: carboxymuconolactone decarboxylase family protein [Gammaproteobacteria bacterium]|nr:carboxymuconolactone decarboxylase family protein [Gammaproteobacteria bacterium]
MNIDVIKNLVPDFAKDIRLNVSTVLKDSGSPGLNEKQIAMLALASAYAARNEQLVRATEQAVAEVLDEAEIAASRGAAAIMGMNNIYYRFLHLVENEEYARMPAKLRMNIIGAPGIDRNDFELLSLAVSAINGCGACVASHEKVVRKHGLTADAVQSAVRIAAVMHAAAVAIEINATGAAALQAA